MIILSDESLSNYSSYKIGGVAKKIHFPIVSSDCLKIFKNRPEKVILFGGGTNILFPDGEINDTVVCLKFMNRWIVDNGNTFLVGAGVLLDDLVKFAIEKSVGGFENLSGIPGTIGGAIVMNAGAFGVEIKDILDECKVYDLSDNSIKLLKNNECLFGYRKAEGLKNKIVLSARFKKKAMGKKAVLLRKRLEILKKREEKQPLDYPSCGSVFKRPKNGYAGELIEKSGLKGFRIGGAKVSEKHANFIINVNNATSEDVKKLIRHIQNTVKERFGVYLEPEVKIIS